MVVITLKVLKVNAIAAVVKVLEEAAVGASVAAMIVIPNVSVVIRMKNLPGVTAAIEVVVVIAEKVLEVAAIAAVAKVLKWLL